MSAKLVSKYNRFRQAGYRPVEAMRSARILIEWDELESAGLVRLRAEPEQESYFDVFGEPEGYEGIHGRRVSAEQERNELIEEIDRNGCWYVRSDYFDGGRWHHADSVGMCTGYNDPLSPIENCYVPDLMLSAIESIPQQGEH